MDSTRPLGRKFTDIYREPKPRVEDSARFRRRFAHKLNEMEDVDFIQRLRGETGIEFPFHARSQWWIDFVDDLMLDDLLDFVTISAGSLANATPRKVEEFIDFVQRAMNEENMSFEVDDYAGVHYRVDQAFQDAKFATLDALAGAHAVAARKSFESAQRALTSHPGDTLAAVRDAFDAVENLFKMKFKTSRLGAIDIKGNLNRESDGSRAGDAARRFNAAFAEWVNACHQYRHAAGTPDPLPPPRWLAVALVDGAATYIRYLTDAP